MGSLICYKCLKPRRSINVCKSKKKCFWCKTLGHHSALCNKQKSSTQHSTPQKKSKGTSANSAAAKRSSSSDDEQGENETNSTPVGLSMSSGLSNAKKKGQRKVRTSMLLTATSKLRNPDPEKKNAMRAQIFLDNGAQRSFITTAMTKKLNLLPQATEELTLYTFNSEQAKSQETQVVEFEVIQRDGSAKLITANAMKHLTCKQDKLPLSNEDKEFLQNRF